MPSSINVLLASPSRRRETIWDNEPLLQDQNYLFYPACGIDYQPLIQFADLNLFSCFVYCDYQWPINQVLNGLPHDYQVLDFAEIGPGRVGNRLRTWNDYFPNEPDNGFAVRARIQLPSHKIIYLYYFGTDAVCTAKILLSGMGVPKCVVLSDNGLPVPMGGNSELHDVYRSTRLPQYLYVKKYTDDLTREWPEYQLASEPDPHPDTLTTTMVLYKRPNRALPHRR
jgi:hypothetical protein